MIYILFFMLICSTLLLATFWGRDFYPFSNYPMFSGTHELRNVKVFRIALEKQDGKLEWWQHDAFRYPEFVGRKLKQIYSSMPEGDRKAVIFATLEKNKLLTNVLKLVIQENKANHNFKAFHLIERTINKDFEITDRTVDIILFSNLKNGMVS